VSCTQTNWGSIRHWGDFERRRIVQSEVEGGVFLHDLPQHTVLEIHTSNRCYTAEVLGEGEALISGHPHYCPEPVLVDIVGSSWGGSLLKLDFVGRGMHLEFHHPDYDAPIVTSPIREIRECPQITDSTARP
jgi:hypothetical protein